MTGRSPSCSYSTGWLAAREPGLRGFSASNLWRMQQLFDAYASGEVLTPLVRNLPWASNLLILARCKLPEERAFYATAPLEATDHELTSAAVDPGILRSSEFP